MPELRTPLPPVKKSCKILMKPQFLADKEQCVAVSLGTHTVGAALPIPDQVDSETMRLGAEKRFCRKPPSISRLQLLRLKLFTRSWLREHLDPLPSDTDVSFETWIDNAPYPEARKAELRLVYANRLDVRKADYRCNSFVKHEGYPEFKHARAINSRSDRFKVLTGPYFKRIEEKLFALPEFIKHIPVADRPEYIERELEQEGSLYTETDHSSFEAHMTTEIMESVEFQLYDYMLRYVAGGRDVMKHIRRALGGLNVCDFRKMVVSIMGTRMSGDMCTSLGNGFTNLIIMKFVCSSIGSECHGVVEGDDGLFRIKGKPPTTEDFANVGFTLKLAVRASLQESSFCGMIYGAKTQENISDPAELLVKFGWTLSERRFGGPAVLQGLLRAKAFSLLYELPGCPIARSLGQYAMRVTAGKVAVRDSHGVKKMQDCVPIYSEIRGQMSYWDQQIFASSVGAVCLSPEITLRLKRPITEESRDVVERNFGVTRATQLQIEAYLDSLNQIQPLNHPALSSLMSPVWRDVWDRFVVAKRAGQR